ncbi:MAG: putative lipid II flippase FtsW [Alphaproteobacteria bacterium]
MTGFARTDTSLVGHWWWTVDRWTVFALAGIIAFGAVMLLAASPPVAERIGYDGLHFVRRQIIVLPAAIALIFIISLQTPRVIRRIALLVFAAALVLVAATFLVGAEIKGARRWIQVAGLSLQPSEFVKPTFAVLAAWLFAQQKAKPGFPGNLIAIALALVVVGLLARQPDLGMAVVVAVVWFVQFYLAGLPLAWVVVLGITGIAALASAYVFLPHVASRIDRFIDPSTGDSYQIDRSIEAFANGGLFGRGPGEGTVKGWLPDAHADFVFAVAGEELGLLACLAIVALFAVVVMRSVLRLMNEQSLFVVLAAAGLTTQLGFQALINMASTLHLVPTKGMTLPFISYGGSSLLALGLGAGMLLALTRRRFGTAET